MEQIVKELEGHSGSQIFLMKDKNDRLFVRKINNVDRNAERLTALYRVGYAVPVLYRYTNNQIDMQYVHGLDIKNYLTHNTTNELIKFILATIKGFSNQSIDTDYTKVYYQKLAWLDSNNEFPFTKEELINRLPKTLPKSMYHGDFTLENIMHTNSGFYMIDPVTIEYDSYIFDIAKMRQDLECKWFLRNSDIKLDTKLQQIQDRLKEEYPQAFDDSLLILMLLRVYLHTTKGDSNYNFIMKEIKRLWK